MFRASRAAFIAALLVSTPAFAQTEEEEVGDIIVTAQRANQTEVTREGSLGALGNKAAEDVPFSIKSYNAALILNQQPQTLGQLLENDPSVRISYGFGNASEQFVIRGFTLAGDDVGLDGLYGITPRQLIAPELYESVQVLNGASAFLFGAAPGGSGIGGSINLIPKRAGRDLMRATLNYTQDEHFGGAFDFARRFGDGRWGVRINGAARRGDVAIDDEFRSTYVLGGALDFRTDNLRASLDLAYQKVRVKGLRPKVTIASATIPRVPRADYNYGQRFSFTDLRDVFGIARIEWDVADNAMIYAVAGARDGSEDGVYDGITVNNATTGDATGSALFVPRTDNNEAVEVGARAKLAMGGISHEINFGTSASWQVNRNAFDFLAGFATNLYNTPQVAQPVSGFVGGNLNDPDPVSRSRLMSAFASDTIGFADDKILLTAGLRLQAIKVTSFGYFGGAPIVYDEDAITPVFGVVVKPVKGVSLFANRIQGLAQGPTAPVDPLVINSGEIFPPFKSTQYEAGAKYTSAKFNASIAIYQTERPSGYSVPVPGGPFQRFGLFGEQRNRGLEASMDGEPVDGLRLIAGLSINDATLRKQLNGVNDGNEAVGVPDYLANANVEWDIGALTLTGRVVRTGKQQVNAANTLQIPAWTRFDLGARYVFAIGDAPLTLRATVDNVANKRYWASAFDTFAQALLQGGPRTVKLSASVDF